MIILKKKIHVYALLILSPPIYNLVIHVFYLSQNLMVNNPIININTYLYIYTYTFKIKQKYAQTAGTQHIILFEVKKIQMSFQRHYPYQEILQRL